MNNATNYSDAFRQSLADWLDQADESKRAFSARTGLSRSHLDKILAGDCSPSLDVAGRICEAIGEPLSKLIGERLSASA